MQVWISVGIEEESQPAFRLIHLRSICFSNSIPVINILNSIRWMSDCIMWLKWLTVVNISPRYKIIQTTPIKQTEVGTNRVCIAESRTSHRRIVPKSPNTLSNYWSLYCSFFFYYERKCNFGLTFCSKNHGEVNSKIWISIWGHLVCLAWFHFTLSEESVFGEGIQRPRTCHKPSTTAAVPSKQLCP